MFWSPLGDRSATLDLDVFDTQSRFVAVDLLRADRLLVCFHSRLDHRLFRWGIEPRSVQLSHGESSIVG